MKAAVLTERTPELKLQDVPDPTLTPGSVIVKVLATRLVHYFKQVFSAQRPYPIQLPLIPGCGAIGIVEEVGRDSSAFKKGDLVYCDCYIKARDDPFEPEDMLSGLLCPKGNLSSVYRHGSFAEKALYPVENVTVIPKAVGREEDAAKLTSINLLLVAYGGILSGNLKAGETVVILGGTGYFGCCGVVLALAMGARSVIVPTRSVDKAKLLQDRFGERVVPVITSGDEKEDEQAITKAAQNNYIDLVLDLLDPQAPLAILRSALCTLRADGTMVLMAGSAENIELPYFSIMKRNITIKGCFMYPRTAIKSLFGMIQAGLIDLDLFTVTGQYSLDEINEALTFAEAQGGAFKTTVVTP
ncbi:hypothetical protein INT43_006537 [Umbelopsis isabellina]|uniref:Alcohol dehydrogenase n=1 Tax=Mortierella isabellina TaxID=91625 RepID=A0A8H7UF75_MORIS|nr:hypothetical protein INT43_006537 [Umbelopsis isabellina]